MGCGAQGRVSPDHQPLQSQLEALSLAKTVIYDDRLALITEVTQMRTNVSDMLRENEMLKMRIDNIISSDNPQVFADNQTQEDLIANWREMDLRDGDVLLEALGAMHQASSTEVSDMLKISSDLRQSESSLNAYCNYFSKRFSLFNTIWQRAVLVRFDIEATFKRFREEIAVQVQGVESALGKKSAAVEDLKKDFRELVELKDAEFAKKHQLLTMKIFGHRLDLFNKKLEDKDVERQRVIAWYDNEIVKLKAHHQNDLLDKDNERERLRASMQATIDLNQDNYAKERQDAQLANEAEKTRLGELANARECLLSCDFESYAQERLLEKQATAQAYAQNQHETALAYALETQRNFSSFEQQKSQLLSQLEELRSAHALEIANLTYAHSEAVNELNKDMRDREELAARRMAALGEEILAENVRFDEVRDRLERRHSDTVIMYDAEVERQQREHREEVEKLTKEYNADRSNLKDRIEKRVKEYQKLQVTTEYEISTIHRRSFEERQELLAAHSIVLMDKDRAIQELKEVLERETIRRMTEVRQASEGRDDQLQVLVNERKNEFMKLRRKLETETEKHELVLRKMQQQHEQFVANMMEKHRGEVEEMRVSHLAEGMEKDEILRKVQSESQAYVNEIIEKYRGDLAYMLASSQEDLKRKDELLAQTRAEFLLQTEQLLQKQATELLDLRTTYSAELQAKDSALQKAELDHQDAIHQLMDKYREDIEKLRVNYQAEIRGKGELLAEADRKNSLMTDKFREDLAAVRMEHGEELQRREKALEKLKKEHRALFDTLTEKHFTELSSLRASHSEALRMRDESERALESSHKAAIHQLMDKYREDLDRIRSQQQADVQQKDQQLAAKISENQQKTAALVAKNDSEMADLRKNFADESQRKDEILAKSIENHRAEVRSLLQQSADDTEELQRSFTEELRAKSQEMKAMQDDYETKIREINEKHSTEMAEMKRAHAQSIEEKDSDARKTLAEYDIKLAEIVDKYREDLVNVREHHTWDTKRKDEMGEKIREEHGKQLAELVDRYTKEIAQLRAQHSEELQRKDDLLRSSQQSFDQQLAATIAKFTSEIASLNDKHAKELSMKSDQLSKMQSDFDVRSQELTASHIKELHDIRLAHTEETQRREKIATEMQKEHSEYVNGLMDKFRDDLGKTRSLHQEDIARKEAQIAAIQAENRTNLEDIMKRHKMEIDQLEHLQQRETQKKEELLETIVKAGETRLSETGKKHEAELNALRDAHQEALRLKSASESQLQQTYESKLALSSEQHSSELFSLKTQYSTVLSAKEDQIRDLNVSHSAQIQALIAKFMSEAATNRKSYEGEIKRRDDALEAQHADYEKQLESLKISQLDEIRSVESAFALKTADLLREFEVKETNFASSLLQLLEEFLIRTAFLRENHVETREKHLRDMPIPNKALISGLNLSISTPKGDEKEKPQDISAFSQAFDELQEGLYMEKSYIEMVLGKDLTVIKGLGGNIGELLEKIGKLEQELASMGFKVMGLENIIADKEMEEEKLRQIDEQTNEHLNTERKKATNLSETIQSLENTIYSLQFNLKSLQSENVATVADNTALHSEIKSLKTIISNQESIMSEYKGLTLKEQNDLKVLVQRCSEDLSHRDMKIKELAETIREMEIEFAGEKQKKAIKSVLVKLIVRISDIERKVLTKFHAHSRNSSPQPPPLSFRVSQSNSDTKNESESIWNEELKAMLENNLLLEVLKKTGKGEKPLTLNQVLKFFEEIMDRKFESDVCDFKSHRSPLPMQEFVIEHLTRTFGLRKLALKMVCQLVPALITLHREQQAEVVLFCRLLQLVNPAPIPLQLAVFLTKVRVEFAKYAKTYQLERNQSSIATRAYLVDIFAYVYALFEDDPICGTDLLRRLRPEEVPLDQYVLFKVCNKMAILSMNSEEVFAKMDVDGSGRMSEREFVSGVQRAMELWISDDDLCSVFRLLSSSGSLTRDEFISQLNFKQYLEKCRSELFTVTKTFFLTALIEVFYAKQVRDVGFLLGEIGSRKVVDEMTHEGVVARIRPMMERDKVVGIWRKVTDNMAGREVTLPIYIRILLRSAVLPPSVFCM